MLNPSAPAQSLLQTCQLNNVKIDINLEIRCLNVLANSMVDRVLKMHLYGLYSAFYTATKEKKASISSCYTCTKPEKVKLRKLQRCLPSSLPANMPENEISRQGSIAQTSHLLHF